MSIDVSVERDGKLYTGSYTVDDGVVTVRSVGGSKATPIGNSSLTRMAQLLLLELAWEHRRETAAMKCSVPRRRRGEASDTSSPPPSPSIETASPPDLYEVALRLDHIQALAEELAKCHRDLLVQMNLATRLQHEVRSARLALPPRR